MCNVQLGRGTLCRFLEECTALQCINFAQLTEKRNCVEHQVAHVKLLISHSVHFPMETCLLYTNSSLALIATLV